MMTTTFRIGPAPKFAGFMTPDCQLCGHPELEHAVYLIGSDGSRITVGSGCAAKLLDIPRREIERESALRSIDEAPSVVRQMVSALRGWKPGRNTAKLRRDLIAYVIYPATDDDAGTAFALWKMAYA